jgi:high-affinity nickel-transport protein
MTSLLAILALGFFLGMRHATDADHVIAVTTIVTRQRSARQAALVGLVWGAGHTITILVVGSAIILFSLVIPPRLGLTMEFSVGVMLILLGLMNITGMMRWIRETFGAGEHIHSHPHSHGDYVHAHAHGHQPEAHPHGAQETPVAWLDRFFGTMSLYQVLRPLVVGIVHGLAGSAAVALLVLTTIRTPAWAIAYLLVFGLGTIAGMMLITMAIAAPLTYGRESSPLVRSLGIASGLLSLGFGLFVVYHIGFVDGLFTAHPHWTPR